MALGALVDAGADPDEVRALLGRLPVEGWELEVEPVLRCGIAATKVHVPTRRRPAVVRTAAHITGAGRGGPAARAGAAPGAGHVPGPRRGRGPPAPPPAGAGPLPRGRRPRRHRRRGRHRRRPRDPGRRRGALQLGRQRHGHGAGRARAAAQPARRRWSGCSQGAPTHGVDIADRAHHADGRRAAGRHWPPAGDRCRPCASRPAGSGPGASELDGRPNAVQVVLGEPPLPRPRRQRRGRRRPGQPVVLLEANVDDATGEVLAHAVAALLDAGAHDAWVTPVVMKKGRPAHVVSALADPALAAQVAAGAERRDRDRSACGARPSSAGPGPGRSTRSRSPACRCGSRSARVGSRSSTTTPPGWPGIAPAAAAGGAVAGRGRGPPRRPRGRARAGPGRRRLSPYALTCESGR